RSTLSLPLMRFSDSSTSSSRLDARLLISKPPSWLGSSTSASPDSACAQPRRSLRALDARQEPGQKTAFFRGPEPPAFGGERPLAGRAAHPRALRRPEAFSRRALATRRRRVEPDRWTAEHAGSIAFAGSVMFSITGVSYTRMVGVPSNQRGARPQASAH